MNLNIDLASKGPECCSPAIKSEPATYYPTFHYDDDKPLKVPEEGEMVIRYKKVASSKETRGDKPRFSCTIEIREIVSADAEVEAPAKSNSSEAGDALDKIMREKLAAKETEDY